MIPGSDVVARIFGRCPTNEVHGRFLRMSITLLTLELNSSAQRCLPKFFLLGILIFKGLTARRLYKSFGVKGLKKLCFEIKLFITVQFL
jgi:hypothetical protein